MIWDQTNDISLVLPETKWEELRVLAVSLVQQSEVRTTELMATSPFSATVDGIPVVGNIDKFIPTASSDTPLEAHQLMVDLQIILAGTERIDVHPTSNLHETVAYDTTRDVAWYAAPRVPAATLTMTHGTFAIFFPRDAHRPKMPATGDNNNEKMATKIVFKIPVRLF